MARIEFGFFRELVRTQLAGKDCPVKKKIGECITQIGKPSALPSSQGIGGYARYTDAAQILTGLHWEGEADSLIDNLSRHGRGHAPMAMALWYWMYCHSNRKAYAQEVANVAYGQPDFLDEHFNINPDEEMSAILRRSLNPNEDIGPLVDINILGDFLDSFLIRDQTDPCLLILLSDMEKMLEPMSALCDGAPASVRSVLGQQAWIDVQDVDVSDVDATKWTYKGLPFMQLHNGTNFLLFRSDGARLSTSALHRMNSWLMSIWQLHSRGTIPTDRLDLILRYILVLCSYGRGDFMKFYFNDDARELDVVFKAAAQRAHVLDLDMRDYGTLDAPYDVVRETGAV